MGEVLAPIASAPVQADSDATLIRLWLHGRPVSTQRAYQRDVADLLEQLDGRGLRAATLGDVQAFAEAIAGLAPASRARKLAAVKSLTAFGLRLGYLKFDVASPVRLPAVKNQLAEKIIGEAELQRMFAGEPDPRNHALLRLTYAAGLRVSEVCGLSWRDLRSAKGGGQATIFGKGGKTRTVLVQPRLWRELTALRGAAGPDDPVFRSREGGRLERSQVWRIVKAAAARAGLDPALSTHWLRHAHVSHALDHGAPVHVVQASVGHASLSTTTQYSHVRPGDGSARYLPE